VTGGSGYLGRVVAERATAAGWSVVAASPSSATHTHDVRDAGQIDALVAAVEPRAVVHTAYRPDGPDARPTIVDGSAAVARAAAAAGARLVHVSTDVVFDGRAGRPYVEDDPPCPLTAYGRAKADAEDLVLAADPAAVVVRTSLIVGGPGRPPSPHERMAFDPAAVLFTDEWRCPVSVDDLADVLVELSEGSVAGILHAAGADALSRWELGALVAGPDVRSAPAPPGRPLDCRLDSSRARRTLRTRLRGAHELFATP
jgi:dTDP-4-dehydrorhamnose reductase